MATNDSPLDQNHDLALGETPDQSIESSKEEKQQSHSPPLSTSSQSPPPLTPPPQQQQQSQDEEQKEKTTDNNSSQEYEDLEEGELKDDDDDDDDEDEVDGQPQPGVDAAGKRQFGYNNNNDDNNNSGFAKELSYNDNRNEPHLHQQPYLPHYSANNDAPGPHYPGRRMSPNNQHLNDSQGGGQYPPNNHHHFNSMANNNHYRYPPGEAALAQPPMNLHNQMGGPGPAYARGGPGGVGPMQKVNIRCRFYSKVGNKCTWGDHCRFEHRDESPGPEFDGRPSPGMGPNRGPPMSMGSSDRGQYPLYSSRHQPYPPPPLNHGGYPYEAYGHHHSTPPPMAPYWRSSQQSPYPSASSGQPPESVSPSLHPTLEGGATGAGGPPMRGLPAQPPGASSGGGGGGSSSGSIPPNMAGGANSPSYPSPSSSFGVYERKHRLAYESAPWNDRNHPPPSKYDRAEPAGYPSGGRGFNRNHYSREPPYGREPLPPMCAQYPGYPAYPSAYRGGQMGPHTSHYKFMSSSQRLVPPDARGSRSMKRGHDEDESSWSDSGSEDSILGQASYSNKRHANKNTKNQDQELPENPLSDDPPDQGSGTPPGEPLPEDKERQEMLLNKLKEIEDLMAKKKSKQEDPT